MPTREADRGVSGARWSVLSWTNRRPVPAPRPSHLSFTRRRPCRSADPWVISPCWPRCAAIRSKAGRRRISSISSCPAARSSAMPPSSAHLRQSAKSSSTMPTIIARTRCSGGSWHPASATACSPRKANNGGRKGARRRRFFRPKTCSPSRPPWPMRAMLWCAAGYAAATARSSMSRNRWRG